MAGLCPHFVSAAVPVLLAATVSAQAACPMELAVYGDRDKAATVDFTPRGEGAAITNQFRMALDKGVVLDGLVMWTDDVERPNGMLMYKCPEGDVTGEELEACTVWQGVIYSADKSGRIGLLPAERADAPETLIFPDLAYSLRFSSAYGEAGFSRLPWDVFTLQGCQE
ncbi:hypothetical protein [Pseudaminobacter salicylatoxidans]|uniref:hypothetical protein n=1 Tax=Pseudaminobacter salicylatoxidans TaxID=93369 RepID=UPI0002F62382|nr:hypothetical protein [Pseudaminobacter salicylatoxidans]